MLILAKLMHYLSVNRISSLLACTTHEQHDKRLKNCLNHAHKKLFKELSLIRFSILVFIFENHCTVLAVLPTGFGESVIFELFILGCDRPEPSLQALSLFPRCKA